MIMRTMKWTCGHIDVADTIVEIFLDCVVCFGLACVMLMQRCSLDCNLQVLVSLYYLCKYYCHIGLCEGVIGTTYIFVLYGIYGKMHLFFYY
jgi:hypothetical protein